MVGKQISHYRIIEKLGEDDMLIVYKAEDEMLSGNLIFSTKTQFKLN